MFWFLKTAAIFDPAFCRAGNITALRSFGPIADLAAKSTPDADPAADCADTLVRAEVLAFGKIPNKALAEMRDDPENNMNGGDLAVDFPTTCALPEDRNDKPEDAASNSVALPAKIGRAHV
jgi:hypothetical protein